MPTHDRPALGLSRFGTQGLGKKLLTFAVAIFFAACVDQADIGPPGADEAAGFGSFLAGRHAQMQGDSSAAFEHYVKALAEDPDNESLRKRVISLGIAAGRYDEAIKQAEAAIAADPEQEMARLLLAVRDLGADNYQGAVRHLEAARRPETGVIWPLMTAWIEAGLGQPQRAEMALKPLADDKVLALFYRYHRALLLDLTGPAGDADAAYAELFQDGALLPARAADARARFLLRQGRPREAEAVIDDLLERHADSPGAVDAMAALKERRQKPLVANAKEGVAEAFYAAAGALGREQAAEAVEVYYRLALYLRPDFPAAWVSLGDHLENRQNWAGAIAAYRNVPANTAHGDLARVRMAWVLHQQERTEEAIAALHQLSLERPGQAQAHAALGDILRDQSRFKEAAEEYSRALAKIATPEKRHWTLFYARGIAYERSKQWRKAEKDLQKALELSPDQPSVMNYLGYSWIDQGIRLGEARQLIERAVALKPNDGYYVDSLGWFFYRVGQYAQAVEHLERAIELRPDDPVINDHLGDVYWRIGRREEARFQWERALGLKPEEDEATRIRRKLDHGLDRTPTPENARNG
jgi:Flp pilus assembly protein TadD